MGYTYTYLTNPIRSVVKSNKSINYKGGASVVNGDNFGWLMGVRSDGNYIIRLDSGGDELVLYNTPYTLRVIDGLSVRVYELNNL